MIWKKTCLIFHKWGRSKYRQYTGQSNGPDVQQEYVESVKKYLKEETEKREVRFVVLSTFMAYTAHCHSGGTLRQIKQICDNLGIIINAPEIC